MVNILLTLPVSSDDSLKGWAFTSQEYDAHQYIIPPQRGQLDRHISTSYK